MRCLDCPELGMIDERTIVPRATCCLRKAVDAGFSVGVTYSRDTLPGPNRAQRRATARKTRR